MHTTYIATPLGVIVNLHPFHGGRRKLIDTFNRRFPQSPLDPRIESLLLDREFRDHHIHLPIRLKAVTLRGNKIDHRVKAQSLVKKNLEPDNKMEACPSSTPLRFALELDNIWCKLPVETRRYYTLFPLRKIDGTTAEMAVRIHLAHLGNPLEVSMVEMSGYILETHESCVFREVEHHS
jgi:hypothetical protein